MENMYLTRKAIRKLPGKVMKTVPIPEPTIIEGFGCRGQIGGICKTLSVIAIPSTAGTGAEMTVGAVADVSSSQTDFEKSRQCVRLVQCFGIGDCTV